MREIIFSWACLVLFGTLVLYGTFTFTQWNFNPGEWPQGSRGGLAVSAVIWMILLAFVAIIRSSPNEE